MQLNDRMNSSEDELINRIKAGLQDYEEPYVAGRWENFNQGQKSQKGITFRIRAWSSAAAVLLVGFGLFMHIDRIVTRESVKIAKVKKSKQSVILGDLGINDEVTGDSPEVLINETEINGALNTIQKEYILNTPYAYNYTDQNAVSLRAVELLETSETDPASPVNFRPDTRLVTLDSRVIAITPVTGKKDSSASSKVSFEDFLANEIKSANSVDKESDTDDEDSKWDMGLIVSPSYGNTKKLTMGYGVSMAYALSDRIALSSGISINEMAASKDFEQPETMILLNGKVLESAESTLTGIDIPLDIKYHLSKKVYANLGVSAFAVLNQNGKNTFVEAKLVDRSFNTAEGKQETRTFVENQRTIEKIPDADLKSSKYLGLYNFSFGFKQKVSKTKSLSIEPFVKVPIKDSKNETLKLFGTGVRFKLEI